MLGIQSSGMDRDHDSAKDNTSDDQRAVEAALVSAGEALDTAETAEATGLSYNRTSKALEAIVEASKTREGALEVVKQENKYTLRPRSKRSIKAISSSGSSRCSRSRRSRWRSARHTIFWRRRI